MAALPLRKSSSSKSSIRYCRQAWSLWRAQLINEIIQSRIDLASDLVHAAKAGDAAQAEQIIVEFNMTTTGDTVLHAAE